MRRWLVADPILQKPDAPVVGAHRGILLAEDDAMKELMTGCTVIDDRVNSRTFGKRREVPVHFRWPEGSREITYPLIIVDFVGISHAKYRETSVQQVYPKRVDTSIGDPNSWHANPSAMPYWPSEYADIADHPAVTHPDEFHSVIEMTPIDLVYQISTHCRNWQHDRQLMSYIITHRLPFRHGHLVVEADNTSRTLTNMGVQASNYTDQDTGGQKLTWRKVWTVSITAEYSPQQLVEIGTVLSVNLELDGYQDPFD